MVKRHKIVAISGSIREGSSNTNILKALAVFIPKEIDYIIYNGIEELPHFNPDVDRVNPPSVVIEFRKVLAESQALIICTPEYAKGVPGVLKNALEWLVSSAELYKKPVAVITASPSIAGGDKAHESLLVPAVRIKMNDDATVSDEATKKALRALVKDIVNEIPY